MAEISRLVDTTILIDFFRGHEPAAAWLNRFAGGELAISVVTAAELIQGSRNRHEQKRLETDIASFSLVPISAQISETAWDWYRQYRLKDGVGFFDCLIGASARHLGVPVCTLNEKHFWPFPNLQVERPY